ncbi:hypothetical protein BU23DRAFT_297671 [Bimuria novae-zelandiae CBS 107.79]|uniref:Uncharacterized protein n=1 Tax=Bimuria novae-zelandiae CBS 107.79 TaxID=1447943 RepID=A0A6A5VLX9_9PLEO|nr:hypothetical protein BU23DRAFT_297671 [Bimuria novae-zelandiae CBS 107.79]
MKGGTNEGYKENRTNNSRRAFNSNSRIHSLLFFFHDGFWYVWTRNFRVVRSLTSWAQIQWLSLRSYPTLCRPFSKSSSLLCYSAVVVVVRRAGTNTVKALLPCF